MNCDDRSVRPTPFCKWQSKKRTIINGTVGGGGQNRHRPRKTAKRKEGLKGSFHGLKPKKKLLSGVQRETDIRRVASTDAKGRAKKASQGAQKKNGDQNVGILIGRRGEFNKD